VRALRAGFSTGPILAVLLALFGATSCETQKSVFPTTGSMRVVLRDNDLAGQGTSGSVQAMRWILESVTGTISGVQGDFPFMAVTPCFYQDNVFFRGDLSAQCLGTGVILGTGAPTTATFHVTASRIEMHRANRPDLPDLGDYDGDGVLNVLDNCKIVANPPDPTTCV
jgi:hypothetical protein